MRMELNGYDIPRIPQIARRIGFDELRYSVLDIPALNVGNGFELIVTEPTVLIGAENIDLRINCFAPTVVIGNKRGVIVETYAPFLIFDGNVKRLDAYLRSTACIEGGNIGQTNILAAPCLELKAVNMREFNAEKGWQLSRNYEPSPLEGKGLIYFNGGGKGVLRFEYDDSRRLGKENAMERLMKEMA
jgi:hypothetical protein